MTFNVSLDLSDGGPNAGDNAYTACGAGSGNATDPAPGEGLYNASELDTDGDGTPEETDEACGDLPALTLEKSDPTFTPLVQASGSYMVAYTLTVTNEGGGAATYSLSDTPGFDDDVVISAVSYVSDAPGNAGNPGPAPLPGAMNNTAILLTNGAQPIAGNTTHTYTINFTVDLDLSSASAGDNVYTACNAGPSLEAQAGEGLYNAAELTSNGLTVDEADACGDLPIVDVALTKVVDAASVMGGPSMQADEDEVIQFDITVVNQGTVPASDVVVYDTIPCGFDLDLTGGVGAVAATADNSDWTLSAGGSGAFATIPGPIAPGGNATVSIFLRVVPTGDLPAGCDLATRLDNRSEIDQIEVPDGLGGSVVLQTDEDSEFDVSNENEDSDGEINSNSDNVVSGDGTGSMGNNDPLLDDDDEDGANVLLVDVALRKTIDETTSPPPYNVGQSVKFDVTVFNQGNTDVSRVDLVDNLPSGLTYDMAATDAFAATDPFAGTWMGAGPTVTRSLDLSAAPLTPGDSITVSLFATINPPGTGTPQEQYTNVAEISEIDAELNGVTTSLNQDADSSFDADPNNDTGGVVGSDDDDNVRGGGPARNEDEDDADPAFVSVALLSLGSTVWIDGNNDGMQNNGELAVPGVEIQLFDAAGAPVDIGPDGVLNSADDNLGMPYVTDADGNYYFSNLTPGDYSVGIPADQFDAGAPLEDFPYSSNTFSGTFAGEVDPDNDVDNDDHGLQTGPGTDVTTDQITLMTGTEPTNAVETAQGGMQDDGNGGDDSGNMTLDLGFTAPVTVGDTVFVDLNEDGLQDNGEPGLSSVTVTIFDQLTMMPVLATIDGTPYPNQQQTDISGSYLFENLPPGNYYVEFDLTTAPNFELYDFTVGNAGMDDARDSDVIPLDPMANVANSDTTGFLTANTEDLTLDAGVACAITVEVADPATICSTQPIDLTVGATITPASLGGFWEIDGDGNFLNAAGDVVLDNSFGGPAVAYRPGPGDARRGFVVLTLRTNDPGAIDPLFPSACQPVSAAVRFEVLRVDCGSFLWDGR